jgi:hypothetical protein
MISVRRRDSIFMDYCLNLEVRNELLTEKLADVQKSVRKLNKELRLFKAKHFDCKKIMFLYR